MYAAKCLIECDKAGGGKIKPGEFVLHQDAYLLCMPGYRNAAPRFEPADEATAAKVAEEMAKLKPVVDQTKVYLQTELDKLAGSGKLQIDPATGFFKRDADGVFLGKMTDLEMHILETAEGYGLKPVAVI